VIGTGRGKGFQGVVRRHHFAGGAHAWVDVSPRAGIDRRIILSIAGGEGDAAAGRMGGAA